MNTPAPINSTPQTIEYFLSRETPGTAKTYSSALRGFFAWINKDFRDVSPFDAMDYNTYLKGIDSPATVQRKISTLNRFYAFAMSCGLIQANPFTVVKQQRPPNKAKDKFLTVPELDQLLSVLSETGPREYVLGLLLASLGLRISEAVNLSHNDFIESPSGDIEVRLLRKGNKVQFVPLRQDVWEVVKSFIGHGPDAYDTEPLFKNPSGDRISARSVEAWIKKASEKAGISKPVTPHWIRHTTATHLLDQKESLENVCWLLGHSSIQITQLYTHPTDKKISEKMPIKVITKEA